MKKMWGCAGRKLGRKLEMGPLESMEEFKGNIVCLFFQLQLTLNILLVSGVQCSG